MNEQELLEAISGHVSFGNMQPVMDAAKAYADARESKEIAELKADNARWCKDFYKVKFELETAEAEIKRLRDVIRELWNRDAISLEEMREILSPAPVTEKLNEDQV